MSDDMEREEDLRKSYGPSRESPAIFVNNFYVTGSTQIIRIAFGESADEPIGTRYRVTVAVPLGDARESMRIVSEMISEIDEEESAEKTEK